MLKKDQHKTAIDIGILIQNKSVAHYTSQKAKYGGLYLYHKIKDLSYIFSLVAKSDMQVSCVIFWPVVKVILYLPIFHYKWKYHFALAKYHAEGISLAVRQI